MRLRKSNFVLSLLPVAATALPLVLTSPAFAGGYYVGNGGQGGLADDAGMENAGGLGGDGVLGYDGFAGSGIGGESGTGGGGGGSGGGGGGAGGQGSGGTAPAGGAGGAMAGDNGGAGADANFGTTSGGGGGGGGAHGEIVTGDVSYSGLTLVFGGVGGAGGVGGTPIVPLGGGGGGAGGAGGAGLFVQVNDVVVTNDGYIGGGDGGGGGAGGGNLAAGFGGGGGQGGVGVYVLGSGVTIVNSGTIAGGTGGGYGTSFDSSVGQVGAAGYAIYGENISIINSGEIIAGQSGGHNGPAIVFAGTENRLELQDGWSITGGIFNFDEGSSGTFALGGDADSAIGEHDFIGFYRDMGRFEKVGASTWTVNSMSAMDVFGTIKEGTLRFSGGVSQESDSVITFWMTPEGTGRITTDSAPIELAGHLVIAYQPGVYYTGTHQLFAVENPDDVGDVVTGTFGTVDTAFDGHDGERPNGELPDGVEQEIIYNELDVLLSITGMSVSPTNTAAVSAPATTTLDNAQFANDLLLGALDTLTGTPDSGDAADNGGYVRMSYAEEVKVAGLVLPPPASTTTSVWGKALGRTTSIDATGGKSGVDAKSGGFMVGADRVVDGALTLGVAAGYSITSFEDDLGSDGTINTVRVAGYGRYTLGAVGIDAALGYAHDFFETDRAVAGLVANSDHGGDEVNAAVALHVDYDFDGMVLTPKAGLRYTHLWEDGYTETGAPGFNLTVASDTADSLQPFVGAKLAKVFHSEGGTKLTPSASIEYAREVLDAAPTSTVSVGGGSFLVKGVEPSRNRLSLGVGLGIAVDKNVSVQVGYKAVVPFDNFFEQTVEISAVWKF